MTSPIALRELFFAEEALWEAYAFWREPLALRLSPAQKHSFFAEARRCGEALFDEISASYPGLCVRRLAQRAGVNVSFLPTLGPGLFAGFTPPNEISVGGESPKRAAALFAEMNLPFAKSAEELENALLAHELFHFFEAGRPGLFVRQKVFSFRRFGLFPTSCRLVSLSEAAAMEFARRLCRLPFSPYALDPLLLYAQSPKQGEALMEALLQLRSASAC